MVDPLGAGSDGALAPLIGNGNAVGNTTPETDSGAIGIVAEMRRAMVSIAPTRATSEGALAIHPRSGYTGWILPKNHPLK